MIYRYSRNHYCWV